MHEPIEIMQVINNASIFEEDKQVKELMSIHGIEHVRGGTYSKVKLTAEEKLKIRNNLVAYIYKKSPYFDSVGNMMPSVISLILLSI